ncbi:MAG: chloride channel protein [Methanothrix sp.]|uniref:Chloride transporter, chloride channel (ClC) family protein n=1 Tax=Methanothrix harundinacea TaxID=301375 RepID=A0A101FUJ7_9EURY|nr:MAG: chloride channel protein [Methanosaeta sp. SDB]KUK44676.1 MAG: Chloride transporter, chloride channel (ClC) family protein [Methanothrix harundinacea]MDD2638018.1 chloride channel protein [Methanothrix sp.]MDI9399363.1 chloride channel protein [Euryarchaeota archaeon]KUK96536.1 MAG: Chloride transporter, chloride channel (ClC) family protein [Methanothrix harundinacea]
MDRDRKVEEGFIERFSKTYNWAYIDFLAILIGVAGGAGAIAFRNVIELIHDIFFSGIYHQGGIPTYSVVLFPIIGGLIVGPIVCILAPEAKGHGVPQIIESLQVSGGQIRKRVGFLLILSSAVIIGSGGSAGREGPIAQIGASFGSLIGQIFKLGSRDLKLLTVCGVAAGIAGTFNAPMGGAIFSMEVVARRFSPFDSVPILMSAVVGAAVAAALTAPAPAFFNPEFVFSNTDLALCFILGPIFGAIAFSWVRVFYLIEDSFEALRIPKMAKPALGGTVAGISGYYLFGYGIMGVGYDGITRIFEMPFDTSSFPSSFDVMIFLIALGLVKILATAFTVGSGGSGGIFAPSLYIGFMFGVAFGLFVATVLPELDIANPTVYGLLGMAALFAGAARAPLTCIVMIPEMASSYSRLPPIIIACVLSYATAQILMKGMSIYSLKLMRKGIFIDQPQPVLRGIAVGEAMHRDIATVAPDMTLRELRDLMFLRNHTGFPVVEDGRLVGIITFDDLRKVPIAEQDKTLVGDLAVKEVITIRPDQSTKYAMDLMYQNKIGRLPVVSGADPKKLLGIITRTDVIGAYETTEQR